MSGGDWTVVTIELISGGAPVLVRFSPLYAVVGVDTESLLTPVEVIVLETLAGVNDTVLPSFLLSAKVSEEVRVYGLAVVTGPLNELILPLVPDPVLIGISLTPEGGGGTTLELTLLVSVRPFVRVVASSDDTAPPLPTVVVVAATVVTAVVALVTVATEGRAFLDVQ